MTLFGAPAASAFGAQGNTTFNANTSTAQDAPVISPPSDAVSSLNFTPDPSANFLCSTSWSGQVQLWDVAIQGTSVASQPKTETKHDLALDSAWTPDGKQVLTCGCDRTVKLWDLGSNAQKVVAQHDAPIRHVCVLDPSYVGGMSVIVTGAPRLARYMSAFQISMCKSRTTSAGGWDSKLKYWDLRTNGMVGEVHLGAKIYAMDARDRIVVVGTAEEPAPPQPATLGTPSAPGSDRTRKIHVFDVAKPTQAATTEASPLSFQTRCVAAFPGGGGYLVGSIEGRVAVQNCDGMHPEKQASYTFKCHRRTLDANGNVSQNAKVCPRVRPSQVALPECNFMKATLSPNLATPTVNVPVRNPGRAVRSPPSRKHKPMLMLQGQYGRKDVYDEVYAVNVIRFHPSGTFMTAGSDGNFTFWDKDEKARLCKSQANPVKPITAASYNSQGSIMAYASGYDWSQGHAHHDPTNPANQPQILLHRMEEREHQRRKNTKK